jgi:hypothetical protein
LVTGNFQVTNPDFDSGCVCKSTGRKPVFLLSAVDVIAGQQCIP